MADSGGAPSESGQNVWGDPPYHRSLDAGARSTNEASGRRSRPLGRWVFALKVASFPKLLVPMMFGQAIGIASMATIDPIAVLVAFVFTLFDLCFIVLLNDWADRDVDGLKRRMFPNSGSPKTIPDGVLPASAVLAAALVAGALALATAGFGSMVTGHPWLFAMGIACVAMFVAYSLPPVRLNYRGGGEILEALGVGAALPLFCIHAHTGRVFVSGVELLPGSVALALSSAVASGLADEESDRRGGKKTVASVFGNVAARRLAEWSLIIGAALWALLASFSRRRIAWTVVGAAVVVVTRLVQVKALSPRATTNAFEAHRAYKSKLHHAIWDATCVLTALSVAESLL